MASSVISERDVELLQELRRLAPKWAAPMLLGGVDGSHHSQTLLRLCRDGLVEKRSRNTLANFLGSRGGYEYRITDAGRAKLRLKELAQKTIGSLAQMSESTTNSLTDREREVLRKRFNRP